MISGDTYDYVIVGAGSAGCVLAGRLSQDPGVRVLLLESGGPDDRIDIHIPLAFRLLLRSDFDWAYESEPQAALGGRRVYCPAGRGLGGSSSINAMVYTRGTPALFDGWGVPGWTYADVLPYFRAAEHQQRGASSQHGIDGPLHVCDLIAVNPLSTAFVDGCAERGLPISDDLSIVDAPGFGYYQVTQSGSQRCSAAVAYLHPALDSRPNLTVRTEAHVIRVLLDGTTATGVRYLSDGEEIEVTAEDEVILAAGAMRSPQLLLLSGIGPAGDLVAAGVPVAADLPGVGENLQDHPMVTVAYHCKAPISLEGSDDIAVVNSYVETGAGPLTSNGNEAGGFIATTGEGPPDLQFHFHAAWFVGDGQANPDGHGFTFGPILVRPRSRGRVSLRTADPLDRPAIDPAYLSDPGDLPVLVHGVKTARRIAASSAFARYAGPEYAPGAGIDGDDEIAAWIRTALGSAYHYAGTCRMGSDDRAVVDPALRVNGVDRLRVCDASVMPVIVNGNPNATVIMIAERAAAMIRADRLQLQLQIARSLP
jgi:choline dehydrogenase